MAFLRRYFAATWSARTLRECAYLMLAVPVASVLFTYILTMYLVGIALAIIWIGVAVAAVGQWTLRPIGEFERRSANVFLKTDIDAPPKRDYMLRSRGQSLTLGRVGQLANALLQDVQSWRVLAWLSIRVVVAPIGFTLAVLALVVPVALVFLWGHALGVAFGLVPTPTPDDGVAAAVVDTVTWWTLLGTPVILFAIPVFAWACRHFASLMALIARWALGPGGDVALAEVTERAEIAETQVRVDQELHDSIGHMITMNIIQAGAGAHVFDADPEFARQALRNIEERGRVAMGELDRIIAAIRGDDAEPRAPLPTLDDAMMLVEQARAAGLSVETTLTADSAPAMLSRAAYAIVREGLTNAAKHSPGADIHVHATTLSDALAVSIRNGPAAAGATSFALVRADRRGMGHGVAGIRDRAALLGGASIIGPTKNGGFEVMALLPLGLTLESEPGDPDAPCCAWSRVRAKVDA